MPDKLLVSPWFLFSTRQEFAPMKEIIANSPHHKKNLLCSNLLFVSNMSFKRKSAYPSYWLCCKVRLVGDVSV